MSWTNDTFEVDAVVVYLPAHAPYETIDSGDAPSSYQELGEGGGLDELGSEDTWPGVLEVNRRGIYRDGTYPDQPDLTAYDQMGLLMRLVHKEGLLKQRNIKTGKRRYGVARLRRVEAGFTPANVLHLAVETTFDRSSRSWFSYEGPLVVTGLIPDDEDIPTMGAEQDAGSDFVVSNAGDTDSIRMEIDITAAAGGLSSVLFTGPDTSWTWTGTVAAGELLRINLGGHDITVDGNDAYFGYGGGGTGFLLDADDHRISDWARLKIGVNYFHLALSPAAEHVVLVKPTSAWK